MQLEHGTCSSFQVLLLLISRAVLGGVALAARQAAGVGQVASKDCKPYARGFPTRLTSHVLLAKSRCLLKQFVLLQALYNVRAYSVSELPGTQSLSTSHTGGSCHSHDKLQHCLMLCDV